MKTCFKCNQEKPLAEFYKHPQMGDGHLGNCKTCTKKDTADRAAIKAATDLNWVLAERERCRAKAQESRKAVAPERKAESIRAYRKRNPLKWAAHCILNNAVRVGIVTRQTCENCGAKAQAHHDDYTKPLDVRWLCRADHLRYHGMSNSGTVPAQPRS